MSSGIIRTSDTDPIISLISRQGDAIPFDITTQITENRSSISIGNGDSADIRIEDSIMAPIQCWLRRDAGGDLFFVNRSGSENEKRELAEKLAKKSGKKSGKNKLHGLNGSYALESRIQCKGEISASHSKTDSKKLSVGQFVHIAPTADYAFSLGDHAVLVIKRTSA